MKVTISEIPKEGLDLELTETISAEPIKIISPVHVSLRIEKEGPEVSVRGTVSGEVELQCSRCLKSFAMTVTSSVNSVYHPAAEILKEEHRELKGEELDTGFYRDDQLDIDELMAEQLLLEVPMKPLCSPQCKGICPQCGTELNTAQCSCEASETDPRLEILKKLLQRKE